MVNIYRPRRREGNVFVLSVCVRVCSRHNLHVLIYKLHLVRYIWTISRSRLSIKVMDALVKCDFLDCWIPNSFTMNIWHQSDQGQGHFEVKVISKSAWISITSGQWVFDRMHSCLKLFTYLTMDYTLPIPVDFHWPPGT